MKKSAGRPIDISRKDIIDAAQRSDIALCFEKGTGFITPPSQKRQQPLASRGTGKQDTLPASLQSMPVQASVRSFENTHAFLFGPAGTISYV